MHFSHYNIGKPWRYLLCDLIYCFATSFEVASDDLNFTKTSMPFHRYYQGPVNQEVYTLKWKIT